MHARAQRIVAGLPTLICSTASPQADKQEKQRQQFEATMITLAQSFNALDEEPPVFPLRIHNSA